MKCLLVSLFLSGATLAYAQDLGNVADVSVMQPVAQTSTPDLRGKPLRLARQLIRVRNLHPVSGTFYIADRNWRNEIKADVVAMQTPQPKTRLAEGSTVVLWSFVKASKEQPILQMPDLRGMTRQEVVGKVKEMGLPLLRPDPDRAIEQPGLSKATDQYPKPQQRILKGTSVYVVFSQQSP